MYKTLLTFKSNYFDVLNDITSPYYSGCLEGVNDKIEQIGRTPYDYRNFYPLLI